MSDENMVAVNVNDLCRDAADLAQAISKTVREHIALNPPVSDMPGTSLRAFTALRLVRNFGLVMTGIPEQNVRVLEQAIDQVIGSGQLEFEPVPVKPEEDQH